MAAGCASTKETEREDLATGNLLQPNQIWVYKFAAMPAEVAAQSVFAGEASQGAAPLTAQQIAEGRKLGSEIATELIRQIQAMGLPATNASTTSRPQANDLVIEGSLLSIQQGSAAERVSTGLTAGESELKVAVEVYQMTANGMRLLGSSDVDATGNKTPAGLIVTTGMKVYGEESGSNTLEGGAKQIAEEISAALKRQFQKQGWISRSAS
ncbi:MAG: DUF4410 domain-containing protein [Steroidobacteraceae bacterium]